MNAKKYIDNNSKEIIELGDLLFKTPELGYKEYKTKKILQDFFKKNNIKTKDLGFETAFTNTTVAMPGSFPDFIVNARNSNLSPTLWAIVIVGLISLIVMFLFTFIYYRFIAFDFANTGRGNSTVAKLIESVGGKGNIIKAESGLLRLNVYLRNPEAISIEKVQEVGPKRVSETKDGIYFEFGTSSYSIAKRINKSLRHKN